MNSKEFIQSCIIKLEDDLQHYTMVDKDNVKAKYIELELEDYRKVLQDLERLETLEIENQAFIEQGTLVISQLKECQQENKKLKKALDIMEENFEIVLRYNDDFLTPMISVDGSDSYINKQEYELLNEVLKDA